jgi:hypothetical protein
MLTKIFAGSAGLAALAAAAPATAQYYGYSPYAYGYSRVNTGVAAQQCAAAVQNRLYYRTNAGVGGVLGAILGANTYSTGRVLSVTRVIPRGNGTMRVSGLASSGRYAGYGPYGVGAYGALGYSSMADLSFRCTVDWRGFVRDVDIHRR